MRIDVRELELGPVALKGEIPKPELGFDPAEIQVLSQIQIDLTAERQAIEVRIRCRLKTEVGLPCSRCLEPVQFSVSTEFDQFYESNAEHPLHGEIALHERDTEIGFYSGDFIEVNDIAREQILLSLPMKPICREDCKGLCPHCGKNPRLVQLLKLKNRMTF